MPDTSHNRDAKPKKFRCKCGRVVVPPKPVMTGDCETPLAMTLEVTVKFRCECGRKFATSYLQTDLALDI